MSDLIHLVVPVHPSAATAGTGGSMYVSIQQAGTYKLVDAAVNVGTTAAANATDNASIGIELDGTNAVTDLTSESTAFTAGTQRDFTLASGSALEVEGLTELIEVTCTKAGSGVAIVGGLVSMTFEKIR